MPNADGCASFPWSDPVFAARNQPPHVSTVALSAIAVPWPVSIGTLGLVVSFGAIGAAEGRAMGGVTKATPLPSAARGRATKKQVESFTAREVEIRACMYCRTIYVNAGYAWRCEHHHEDAF
jgi:hypothetical protein